MFLVKTNVLITEPNGNVHADVYNWRGKAVSPTEAQGYALSDMFLAFSLRYGKGAQVQVNLMEIHEVTPCASCQGTGKKTNVFDVTYVCPECNGQKFLSV